MRRALLSGDLSAREATQKLSSVPMVELSAADNLIGLIESTESALANRLLSDGGSMTSLYAKSAVSLTRKRDAQAARKAVRSAIGRRADDLVGGDLEGGQQSQPPAAKRKRMSV